MTTILINKLVKIVVTVGIILTFFITESAYAARILVDMDGVITNFEKGTLDNYIKEHSQKPFIPLKERTGFYASEDFAKKFGTEYKKLITDIWFKEGFAGTSNVCHYAT